MSEGTKMEKLELERAKASATLKSAELQAYREATKLVVGNFKGGKDALGVIDRVAAALMAREG